MTAKLADFDLSREEIEERYADYYKLFLSRSQNTGKDKIENDVEHAHRSFAWCDNPIVIFVKPL